MKVCPRCGMNCPDEAAYCNICGVQLPTGSQQPNAYGYQQPPQPPVYGQNGQYYGQQSNGSQPYGNQQYQPYPMPGSPYMTPKKSATMTLAIVGLVFALILPIVTYCCSIPGIVLANRDVKVGYNSRTARVLNIVAICVAGINSLLGVILYVSGYGNLF